MILSNVGYQQITATLHVLLLYCGNNNSEHWGKDGGVVTEINKHWKSAVDLSFIASDATCMSSKINTTPNIICNDTALNQLQCVLLYIRGLDAENDNKTKHRNWYSDLAARLPYQLLYLWQHITL